MPFLLEGKNELTAYFQLLQCIEANGFKSSRYKEILNCLLSIEYSEDSFTEFVDYRQRYIEIVGVTAKIAWARAIRVYTTFQDRMTKPSYLRRLRHYEELLGDQSIVIDQIDNIINELAIKPKHSLLSFTVFRPSDFLMKKRPGYIPCPISGDFKFRKGELHFNVFFRSHDALNFGYADIFFLRTLQIEVLKMAKELTTFKALKNGIVGSLNLHFSRAYLPLRMEMQKKVYINGDEIRKIITNLTRDIQIHKDAKTNG